MQFNRYKLFSFSLDYNGISNLDLIRLNSIRINYSSCKTYATRLMHFISGYFIFMLFILVSYYA